LPTINAAKQPINIRNRERLFENTILSWPIVKDFSHSLRADEAETDGLVWWWRRDFISF